MPSPLVKAIHRHTAKLGTLQGGPALVTSTSPLEVSMNGGETLPANRLAGYASPSTGDRVWVVYTDGDSVLILDKLVDGG